VFDASTQLSSSLLQVYPFFPSFPRLKPRFVLLSSSSFRSSILDPRLHGFRSRGCCQCNRSSSSSQQQHVNLADQAQHAQENPFVDNDLLDQILADAAINEGAANQNAAAAAPKNDPIPAAQLDAILDQALERQRATLLAAVKDQISSLQPTPFAGVKRRAEKIANEGIKKQFTPLEETKLRLDAVHDAVAGVAAGEATPIGPEEAVHLQKTLDEGIALVSKRMHFLEVAQVEGWNVAKCLKKNELFLDRPEDMQKQLKRAKKEAKAEEVVKEKKKFGNRKGFYSRRGGRGRGGHGPSNFGGGFGGSGRRPDSRTCYVCGQVGHISATCPSKVAPAANGGRQMM
jgi:hypothetical protein